MTVCIVSLLPVIKGAFTKQRNKKNKLPSISDDWGAVHRGEHRVHIYGYMGTVIRACNHNHLAFKENGWWDSYGMVTPISCRQNDGRILPYTAVHNRSRVMFMHCVIIMPLPFWCIHHLTCLAANSLSSTLIAKWSVLFLYQNRTPPS